MNVKRELANKTDNRTVSYKHRTGRILVQIKKWCSCEYSIPNSRGEHVWQVYVTSYLKINLIYFLTARTMVWIFIALKNRYLNISAVLKLLTTQNELKRPETK